jgi:uncharacterized protein (TIGR02453 family)
MTAFFSGLEENNNREWFQAHKASYEEHVKLPMHALIEALNRRLLAFAPDYITDPARAVYRIYRDTRFSHDKTPYKTHIAATFHHRALEKNISPGLYFSVSHKEIEIAGGLYMPGPDQLLTVRTHIAAHHERLRSAPNWANSGASASSARPKASRPITPRSTCCASSNGWSTPRSTPRLPPHLTSSPKWWRASAPWLRLCSF